jgi:hypothetical protein
MQKLKTLDNEDILLYRQDGENKDMKEFIFTRSK